MATRKGQLTKTVLISGGMQDDVSEFHQADPSCAYIENGRFRKKDEIEKRLPDTKLTDVGLPTSGNPLLLAEQGDTLVTMDEEGDLYTLDQADEFNPDWTQKQTNIIPATAKVAFQSAPEPGAVNFQAMEVGEGGDIQNYKLMAWEVRAPGAQPIVQFAAPATKVVCELRRSNGDLLDREVFEGGRHPRIVAQGSTKIPTLFYQRDDGRIVAHLIQNDAIGAEVDTTVNAEIEHPEVAFLVSDNASVDTRDSLRVGWTKDGGYGGHWDVASDGLTTAIIWKVGTLTRVQTFFLALPVGNPLTIHTDFGTTRFTPLSVDVDAETNRLVTLSSYTDTSTGAGDVAFTEVNTTNTSALTKIEDFGMGVSAFVADTPRVVNGSIKYDVTGGSRRYKYAVTVCGYQPAWRPLDITTAPTQSSMPKVLSGYVDTSLNVFTNEVELMDHRLASQVTVSSENPGFGKEALAVFAVEQWAPHAQPRSNQGDDEFMSCPVQIRPTTTVVIGVNSGVGNYQVLATLGAGQNKAHNGSSSEQSTQLQNAFTIGDTPYITTRTILQPEDISIHGDPGGTGRKAVYVLFPGEAQGKCVALAQPESVRAAKYGDSTLFALAVPCQYDGVAFGEQSVFDQPEITHFDLSPGPDYWDIAYEKLLNPTEVERWNRYSVVVGFADHLGQLHRSAPSTPLWVSRHAPQDTTDPLDDERHLTIGFTMPLSAYRRSRDYFVEVYVAQGEEAQQLAGTRPVRVINGSTTDNEITFTLNTFGYDGEKRPIRFSETLYTEGNVLPSDPWPALDDFVVTSNRLFGISSEVPGTVYYSKLLEEGIAPEFSAPLVLPLGRNRKLTGIGAIDDKVIIFSEREIFAVYDTGPDNTGANGDFVVDRLQTTVGCTEARSIVEVPDGLFFYSGISKEFHLLSRDLQVHDIGKAIEDTAEGVTSIKSAVVVPDEHEIRWYVDSAGQSEFGPSPDDDPIHPPLCRLTNTLPANPVLVYNYHYKKWMVFSGQNGRHAVLFQNMPTYIEPDFDVFQASTNWGDENHRLKIRLPWIRVNQLQSYGRIDEIAFVGKYLSDWVDTVDGRSAGDVQVKLTYDYEEYFSSLDPDPDYDIYRFRANAGDLGASKTFLADPNEGGLQEITVPSGRMQFSCHPGRPKCQAIQIELSEVPTTGIELNEPTYRSGRGWVISGADLIYSPKTGTATKSTPQRTSK